MTHHSFVAYKLPSTGEVVPMLQIAPSKTDAERLLLVSPELGEVLAEVIGRVRGGRAALPLVSAYDPYERTWSPPMPILFQRPRSPERRAISRTTLRQFLDHVLAVSGLTDASNRPLVFTPHDFRRLFATDAQVGRIASDATFPGRREHALPAMQRAALRHSGRDGAGHNALDLGCQQPVASGLTMMRPVRLHRTLA
jgi:integrase